MVNNEIKNWEADESFNGSDHRTILFTMESVKAKKEEYRDYKNADWKLFQEFLGTYNYFYPPRINRKKLDNMVKFANKAIKEAGR